MLSKEEIEKILEQNEDIITYKADKDFRCLTSSEKTLLENNKKIKKYIDQLEQENKALKKGIISLMDNRKKWRNKYYNLKAKNKDDIEGWKSVLDCAKFEIAQREQENNKQSKMIDEMANQLSGWAMFDSKLQKPIILYTEEQVKQYFEKKVEEQ